MRAHSTSLSWPLLLATLAGCSSTGPREHPVDYSKDFELTFEDGSLDTVEFDANGPGVDLEVDRERKGVRFAWGSERSRGFFHVFKEDAKWGPGDVEAELLGAGGGGMGAPVVSSFGDEVLVLIPWRADASLVFGEVETSPLQADVGYVELHAEVAFGVEWKGLRPSVGLALSSLDGVVLYDASGVPDDDISGVNLGAFLDVKYKLPEAPVYAHLRAAFGDYEGVTAGVGFKF